MLLSEVESVHINVYLLTVEVCTIQAASGRTGKNQLVPLCQLNISCLTHSADFLSLHVIILHPVLTAAKGI